MVLDATGRRRWIGALVLAVALAMLVGGETVLKGRLVERQSMLYWLVCLVLTGMAILVAFRDLRALQRRHLEEQRALFQATLKEITDDAHANGRPPNPAARPDPEPGHQ